MDYQTESRNFHTYRPQGMTLQEALLEARIIATDENITQISTLSSTDRVCLYVHILQNFVPRGRLDTRGNVVNATLHWFLVWID